MTLKNELRNSMKEFSFDETRYLAYLDETIPNILRTAARDGRQMDMVDDYIIYNEKGIDGSIIDLSDEYHDIAFKTLCSWAKNRELTVFKTKGGVTFSW